MSNIINLEDHKQQNLPHFVAELICLSCQERWVAVWPQETPLKDLECKCGSKGKVIKTGQDYEKHNI